MAKSKTKKTPRDAKSRATVDAARERLAKIATETVAAVDPNVPAKSARKLKIDPEAEKKAAMAARMAHAREARQAQLKSAKNGKNVSLKEFREQKAAKAATAELPEKILQREKIDKPGHGMVDFYYQAECPRCGTVVKVPIDESGKRIPLGDMKIVDSPVGPVLKGMPRTKKGRIKKEYTPEERQAIADRLQGARAAKLGITLEGLRAIKLRPGAKPTSAQLKKYGVKKSK